MRNHNKVMVRVQRSGGYLYSLGTTAMQTTRMPRQEDLAHTASESGMGICIIDEDLSKYQHGSWNL